jgi:hypothetical protein
MAGSIEDEDEKPLDPAVERVRRKLKRFIAINLGLLFVALMAVAAAIVYRAGDLDHVSAGAEGEIALPAGARILDHALSGDRISLDVELADGSRALYLYDLAEGAVVGRFDLVEER